MDLHSIHSPKPGRRGRGPARQSPKSLASALSVDSSRILGQFQWLTDEESRSFGEIPHQKDQIRDDINTTLSHLMDLARQLEIDCRVPEPPKRSGHSRPKRHS